MQTSPRFIFFTLINILIWIIAGLILTETPAYAAPVQQQEAFMVEFLAEGTQSLDDPAKQAIIDAVQNWSGTAPTNNTFYLIGLQQSSHWAIATLTYADLSGNTTVSSSLDDIPDTQISAQNLIALLLVETDSGWQAALDSDSTLHTLLDDIPLSELSEDTRNAIFPVNTRQLRRPIGQRQQYDGYKLPWPSGFAWARTQSWHGGTWGGRFPDNNSIDFDIINQPNADILAAAPGIVTHICQVAGQQQAGVVIQTSGTQESLGYLHLQSNSIPGGVFIGASIRQGDILGRMVEGNVNEACGYSLGTHVHMFFPTRPFTMDGYTFSDTDTQGGISLYSSQPPSGTLPAAPENRNLVRNGTFSAGFNHWTTQLDSAQSITSDADGNYVAWQGVSGLAGVLAQMLNYSVPADSILEMSLDLGNASPVEKKLRVHLHNHNGNAIWEDMMVCDFYIPANTPLQSYVLRHKTTTYWENMRVWIESSPADALDAVLTDNVRVMRYTTLNVTDTECHNPVNQSQWQFTQGNSPQGWTTNEGMANPQPLQNGLQYTVTSTDALLHSPHLININADAYRYLLVEINAPTECGRVYFQKDGQRAFRESQMVAFTTMPGVSQPYFVDLRSHPSWTGTITRLGVSPTCNSIGTGSVTISRLSLNNMNPDLRLLAPLGVIHKSYGNPTYTWAHLEGVTEYEIYVARSEDIFTPLIHQTIAIPAHCTASLCEFDATTIANQPWLANGVYTVYLRAKELGTYSDWSGGFSFEIAAPVPNSVRLENSTDTDIVSRPIFTWSLPNETNNAGWFNLYVARESDLATPLVNTWASYRDVCDDGTCSLGSTHDFANGRYHIYMRGWGPGGFSQWAGPMIFDIASPPPSMTTTLDVTHTYTRRPILSWSHTENAAWYQVWLGTSQPNVEAIYTQWYDVEMLDCILDDLCTIQPDVLLDSGNYIWYVRAWGPGGFSEGGIQGWAEGTPFTISP